MQTRHGLKRSHFKPMHTVQIAQCPICVALLAVHTVVYLVGRMRMLSTEAQGSQAVRCRGHDGKSGQARHILRVPQQDSNHSAGPAARTPQQCICRPDGDHSAAAQALAETTAVCCVAASGCKQLQCLGSSLAHTLGTGATQCNAQSVINATARLR
jgi:hypothetical protein